MTKLIELARKRGSTATTRAGAWKYLLAHIPTPKLAKKLTARPTHRLHGYNRDRAAAMAARYQRHALAACKRFSLPLRDELDAQVVNIPILPSAVAKAIRKAAGTAAPIVITRSDIAPREEGHKAYNAGTSKWPKYVSSTRLIRVGIEWINRTPELRAAMVAARLKGDVTG
jgi:hypothetical protein